MSNNGIMNTSIYLGIECGKRINYKWTEFDKILFVYKEIICVLCGFELAISHKIYSFFIWQKCHLLIFQCNHFRTMPYYSRSQLTQQDKICGYCMEESLDTNYSVTCHLCKKSYFCHKECMLNNSSSRTFDLHDFQKKAILMLWLWKSMFQL